MKKEKPFYIGWQDKMPAENKSAMKKFIALVFIVVVILTILIIYLQNGFNNHRFELGKSTELIGVYHSEPVPVIELTQNKMPGDLSNHVLLVGYGKFGAEGIMASIEQDNGDLDGKTIKLKGTLIYGDGRTLLELTKKSASLVGIINETIQSQKAHRLSEPVTLSGEIIDPKCYFGVMKPGEGKIHKSCAIRCISGGIPPILKTLSDQNDKEYYILLGESGEKINKKLLDKIAEKVQIKGRTSHIHGWNYLHINPKSIKLIER